MAVLGSSVQRAAAYGQSSARSRALKRRVVVVVLVLVSLTDRGEGVVAARRARYEGRWAAALGEFTTEELRGATAVLERVARMFDEFALDADADAASSARV